MASAAQKKISWRPRLLQHIIIALVNNGLALAIFYTIQAKRIAFGLSMATGYVGLSLIGISLIIGPWNVLHSNPNPISSYFRRDIGIWAGIFTLIHVVVGLEVHMGGKFWLYFIYPPDQPHIIPIRYGPFGFANYTGLAATFVLVALLITSNNFFMRKLGSKLWKKIQRWNYIAGILVIAHGIAYQLIEKRNLPFVVLFVVITLVCLAFQIAGFRRVRKRA